MPTLLKEVRLIKTEIGENANKWWTGQLFDDGTVKATWGRVGYAGDNGEWDGGEKYLTKKVAEKMKKGYTEQKTIGSVSIVSSGGTTVRQNDLHAIARAELIKTPNNVLERLIKRFVDANVHKITANTQLTYNSTTGLFATPLGILTMEGVLEGRKILDLIAPLIREHRFGAKADTLVSQYLRIVPQNVGMKRFTAETVIPDETAIQKQSDLLDSLESSYQATQTPSPSSTGTQERVFKVDLEVMSDVQQRQKLTHFFETSKKSMHDYDHVKVKEIYSVKLDEMHQRFNTKLGRIEEIFHGTSQANCLSILKSGLRVRPPSTAKIAGDMFGCGIYGAKNSTKSLGYSFGRWGQGGGMGEAGWLYICDFAMGKMYNSYQKHDWKGPDHGYDSTWAHASSGGLYNDELIIYRDNQVNIKALIETTPK